MSRSDGRPQRYDRRVGQCRQGGWFGAQTAPQAPECARQRCAARIVRFDIASVRAGLELRQMLPAPEDRGVFDDMNYAENAIEPQSGHAA